MEMLNEICINHKLNIFYNTQDALQHLIETNEQPFIVFSDINMPGWKGIGFKRKDEDPSLRERAIRFVFFSTTVERQFVDEAYKKMTVQSFFQQSQSYEEQKTC